MGLQAQIADSQGTELMGRWSSCFTIRKLEQNWQTLALEPNPGLLSVNKVSLEHGGASCLSLFIAAFVREDWSSCYKDHMGFKI